MKEYVQFWVTIEIDNMNVINLAGLEKIFSNISGQAFNIFR